MAAKRHPRPRFKIFEGQKFGPWEIKKIRPDEIGSPNHFTLTLKNQGGREIFLGNNHRRLTDVPDDIPPELARLLLVTMLGQ